MKEEIKKYLFENFKIKNGEIRLGRVAKTDNDVAKIIMSYSFDNDLDWDKASIISSIQEWKESLAQLKSRPIDDIVKIFIAETCKNKELKYIKDSWYKEEYRIDTGLVYTIFEAEVYDWNRNNPERKLSTSELKIKLQSYEIEIAHEQKKELFSSISYDERSIPTLEKWLNLIHSACKIKEKYEIFKIMFCHWLWQVKRRSLGLTTRDELFINFFGETGTGKSHFVGAITAPFKMFMVPNAKLDSVIDERSIPALGNNFIHFVDELAANSKTVYMDKDLSVLKSIITANDCLVYRPLGTNTQSLVKPRTSLIGASNFHLSDVLMDSSGMRRFFEFNFGLERNRYDIEANNIIKELTTEAWKGINENSDAGYWDFNSPYNNEILMIQDSYIRKDAFTLWFESLEYVADNTNTQIKTLYTQYSVFCEDEFLSHKRISIQSFSNALKDKIPTARIVNIKGSKHVKGSFKIKQFEDDDIEVVNIIKTPKTKKQILEIE